MIYLYNSHTEHNEMVKQCEDDASAPPILTLYHEAIYGRTTHWPLWPFRNDAQITQTVSNKCSNHQV